MRFVKAAAAFVGCLIAGAIAGFVVAALLLPPDWDGVRAPGDGFLLILCMGGGLLLSALAGGYFVIRILFLERPT